MPTDYTTISIARAATVLWLHLHGLRFTLKSCADDQCGIYEYSLCTNLK